MLLVAHPALNRTGEGSNPSESIQARGGETAGSRARTLQPQAYHLKLNKALSSSGKAPVLYSGNAGSIPVSASQEVSRLVSEARL